MVGELDSEKRPLESTVGDFSDLQPRILRGTLRVPRGGHCYLRLHHHVCIRVLKQECAIGLGPAYALPPPTRFPEQSASDCDGDHHGRHTCSASLQSSRSRATLWAAGGGTNRTSAARHGYSGIEHGVGRTARWLSRDVYSTSQQVYRCEGASPAPDLQTIDSKPAPTGAPGCSGGIALALSCGSIG